MVASQAASNPEVSNRNHSKHSASIASTLSGRPMSARRLTLTDQAALDREYRTVKETNQSQHVNKINNKVPRPNSNHKNKDYKNDMHKKLQNI
jgi:hypothetical protein